MFIEQTEANVLGLNIKHTYYRTIQLLCLQIVNSYRVYNIVFVLNSFQQLRLSIQNYIYSVSHLPCSPLGFLKLRDIKLKRAKQYLQKIVHTCSSIFIKKLLTPRSLCLCGFFTHYFKMYFNFIFTILCSPVLLKD